MNEVESTAFVEAVVTGAWRTAVSMLGHAAEHTPPEDLVVQWLAPAAAEVGLRWERNLASIDDSHQSAAIVDAGLDLLVAWNPVEPSGVPILFASAPHDWHVLPSHMAAAVMRWRGWRCDVLGAMTKPVRLEERIDAGRPAAVAISCSRVVHLPAVRVLADSAHNHGIPVLVGGRAVTPARAVAVGADGAAANFDDAARLLEQWGRLPPQPPEPPAPPQEAFELEALEGDVVERCVTRMWDAYGSSGNPRAQSRARDAIRGVVRAVVAAMLLDDDSVLVEELAWIHGAIAARIPVPEGARRLFADVFIPSVPPEFVDTRSLVERVLTAR